jgi:hypothetical protein
MNNKIQHSSTSLSDFLEGFRVRFDQFTERNRLGMPIEEKDFIVLLAALETYYSSRVDPACLTDEENAAIQLWSQVLLATKSDD